MSYNRHIRPAILMLFLAASATAATPHFELSAVNGGVRVDVSDDAPPTIHLEGNGMIPIEWTRGDRVRAIVPLLMTPGATPADVVVNGQPRPLPDDVRPTSIRFDANAYATPWPATDARRWSMLAATAALCLVLASRLARYGTIAVVLTSLLITSALLVYAIRRPDLETRKQAELTWFRARTSTTARLSIAPGDLPIVESRAHLRSLAPRIAVDREGRATLELMLGRGGRVAIARTRSTAPQ